MGLRFLKRHSILAGAALLILAVAVTMLANGGNRGPEPAPFLDPVPSSSQGTASSSGAPSSQAEASAPSSSQPAAQAVQTTAEEEMRAVWVPYMSLDMSKDEDRGEEKFREKFSAIACGAKEYGMNALVVHVRPFGDALYRSQYAPWSHIVSGTQGVDPGYDPLEIMVEIAHGVDLQRDILDQMEFKPVIPEYVRYMDPRLFREGPMGLTPEQMEMLDPEYEFWRDLRPGGEGGESRG